MLWDGNGTEAPLLAAAMRLPALAAASLAAASRPAGDEGLLLQVAAMRQASPAPLPLRAQVSRVLPSPLAAALASVAARRGGRPRRPRVTDGGVRMTGGA